MINDSKVVTVFLTYLLTYLPPCCLIDHHLLIDTITFASSRESTKISSSLHKCMIDLSYNI